MKVALIPPYSQLHYTVGRQYHMLLPACVKNPHYRSYFREMKQYGKAHYIIDNGMFESGSAIPDEELLELATKFLADEIVMPDVQGDYQATLDRIEQFIRMAEDWPMPFKMMGVVQGKGWQEHLECMKGISKICLGAGIPFTFGLPRHLTDKAELGRLQLIGMWFQDHPERTGLFHLLGMSRSRVHKKMELQHLGEVEYLRRYIRSVDTSAPWVWACHDAKVDEVHDLERPNYYFDLHQYQFDDKLVRHNISTLDRWVGSCEYRGGHTTEYFPEAPFGRL